MFSGYLISLHPLCPYAPPIWHILTELHRSFAPYSPPSLPVLDFMSTWINVHSLRIPPPIYDLYALPPLTCSPVSLSVPESPCHLPVYAASPPIHLIPFRCPKLCHVPVYPCSVSLLGFILPPQLTPTTTLPCQSQTAAQFLPVPSIYGSQVSGP